jgi:hypothetical protein
MTLSVALRTRDELHNAIAGEMCCPAVQDGLRRALTGEYLRTAVYAASVNPDQSRRVVHTTRLLGSVRSAFAGLWSREQPQAADSDEAAKLALRDLAEIGDVETVGGGYWLATPLRLIEVSDADSFLVLGSDPTDVVAAKIGAAPFCSGVGRLVLQASLNKAASYGGLVSPIETWWGPTDPLLLWTRNILAAYTKRLSAPDEIDADQLEIYAPDIMRKQRRSSPWVPASHINQALSEPRVCRPLASLARMWDRPQYLGVFGVAQGVLRLRQSALLDFDISVRLRFGFDQLLGMPRTVSLAIRRDSYVLDMRFRLPPPEDKINSLGWSESERNDSRQLTTFHIATLPIIRAALNRLSINQNLVERNR